MQANNNLILFLWLIAAPVVAQHQSSTSSIDRDGYDDIEINGLVVDETITKVGRDFYELFFQEWAAPISSITYTLFIRERPMNGFGSQIAIYINETEIFNRAVQPRYDIIAALAQYAVSTAHQYLQNYESIVQQLGNEDQQGTGIY